MRLKTNSNAFNAHHQAIEVYQPESLEGFFDKRTSHHLIKVQEAQIKIQVSPHMYFCGGQMKYNEFNMIFQAEQQFLAYIASLKPNKCIRCFSSGLNTSDLRRIRCLKCNQTFSILTGTIFSRPHTPLTIWFYLIFRWIKTKHGIPSTDVVRELGVSIKTAGKMSHEIRKRIAQQEHKYISEGIVQLDEMDLSHMGLWNKEEP